MHCRQVIFEVLKAADTSAADQALAAALARVEGETARQAVETLLARRTREGFVALVACWHRLEPALRELVMAQADQMFSVLREAFAAFEEQTRVNVIEIIHRGKFYRATYLLDSGARDRVSAVRGAAVKAVHAMTDELLGAAPTRALEPGVQIDPAELHRQMLELENYQEDRRQLAAAVDAVLTSFDLHQDVGVVEAAMWLVDDLGPRLWKALLIPGSRVIRAAQGLLGRRRDPRLIPFMMQALTYSEFRPIVAQTLATCTDAVFLEGWLRESWRLVQHKSARALGALRDLGCTHNQLLDVVCLPDDAQRHFVRCVLATGMSDEVKVEVIREMLRRGQPAGRRAALWALVGLHNPHATSVLRSIAAESNVEYATIARRELARRRPLDYPLNTLTRAVAKSSRGAAEPERMTAVVYWLAFDRLSEAEKIKQGKELLADGRLPRETISGWLNSPEPGDRVRALRVVTVLDLAADFEEHIYRLCRDAHAEVRSTAVAALGKLPTATARRLLQNTLYDPDARVQANTIEALEQIGAESLQSELVLKLTSPDNRTRANAVKALLKLGVRSAASTLLLMLKHENRAHRASALWLVEQMRLLPLAGRIMEMAEEENDEQLRERAQALSRRMAIEWAESASSPAPAPAVMAGKGASP